MINVPRWNSFAVVLGLGAVILAGCNTSTPETNSTTGGAAAGVSGDVKIDGSTTVYPISELWADDIKSSTPGVKATVGRAGTGSGMKKFAAGEIDIAGASRPIKEEEEATLKAANIEYLEIPVAYDGISVVVNPGNTWFSDAKVEDLRKAFMPGSTVKTWKDINPAWPAEAIKFYGPSNNHGTYEYFTEEIAGKKNEIRADYKANQEYTAIIQAIAGDKNGIGYVGYNYFDESRDQVKAIRVDGIEPSAETIENGTYKPLSRPLFIYVNKKSYDENPAVKAFVEYALSDSGLEGVTEAKYVRLPAEIMEKVRERVKAGTTGSLFMNAPVGSRVGDILK